MALRRSSLQGTLSGSPHGRNDVLDCTTECRMKEHSLLVLSSAYLGNLKLLKHCETVCANSLNIQDSLGRNALHVAASKGHLQLVNWLVDRKKAKINVNDLESKWTELHRSIYYGQLGVSALLLKYGADINALDSDGCSPLALLNADRKNFKYPLSVGAINVYTWGRNPNVTLGHDHTRKYPEKLDLSLSSATPIVKVILSKFHSVFLSEGGHVLTCGHGPGGRLGHDSEQSIVTPRKVQAMDGLFCTGIAAARDHTVFLTKSGAVYTCGLNDAYQLAHGSNPTTAPSNYLAPKLVRALKSKHVIAVGTGRYHTAMCTETDVYTVGTNLGQLGYEKTSETQVAPHAVAGINLNNDVITRMSVSDAATAVLTKKHHVFVCTDFIVKHIRLGFLDKVSCAQFEVCASLSDRDYLRKVETEPTKVVLLDSECKLWFWEPTKRGSFPKILRGFTKHNVKQFSLGRSLTVVTEEGEIYKGSGSVSKPLGLHRVANIQNAHAIFTDFKANNFAYTQNVFRSPFMPSLSPSTLTSDLSSLLEEACLPGSIYDMKIDAGGQTFIAHKFILVSQTRDFLSQLAISDPTHSSTNGFPLVPTYKLRSNCDNPEIFDAFLHYIYGSHIRLVPPHLSTIAVPLDGVESTPDTSLASIDENDLTEEYDNYANSNDTQGDLLDISEVVQCPAITGQSTPKKKSHIITDHSSELEKVLQLHDRRAELKSLLLLATNFDLYDLKKPLEEIMLHSCKPLTLPRPKLKLKRLPDFSDLSLTSKEDKTIRCHRCVLVARSEYFRSMLLMGWKESSDDASSLSMPIGYRVLKAVIDFIYTDEFIVPTIRGSDSIEWVMSVLVVADQLLLMRLKEFCEYTLARIVDMRNVVELLEFAEMYSAQQLKKSCLQFICVNASCFLEGRYLDNLGPSLLQELSQSYQDLTKTVRVIKFPDPDPEMLPESYFLDERSEEDVFQSGDSGNEGEGLCEVADTAMYRSSSAHDTLSPRAVSNSRRKRKRKTSQSSSGKRQTSLTSPSPPPTSPDEDKSILPPRINPSSPIPASPVIITSPSSPVNASAPVDPSKLVASNSSSDVITFNRSNSLSPTLWKCVGKNQINSYGYDRSSKSSICNGVNGEEESILRACTYSAPVLNSQEEIRREPVSLTPLSAPSKVPSRVKSKSKSRIRLVNKFKADTRDPDELIEPKTIPNGSSAPCSGQNSAPVVTESVARRPWACVSNGIASGAKSLRDIMAKEEEETLQKQRQEPKQRSPPLSHEHSAQNGPVRSSPRSQPIHVYQQKENLPSPSNGSSSPASNPWKTSGSSPAVSMRELMAEAEAEAKHNRRRVSTKKDKVTKKTLEEKPTKKQPSVPPYQQVSFASILKSQEAEMNSSRSAGKKALSLIQIEEHAISELEKAYSMVDNPDEFITVERYRCSGDPTHHPLSGGRQVVVPQDSPWTVYQRAR